jgi:hypothetical protein
MNRVITVVLFAAFLFASDWLYEDLKFSGGDIQSLDTIESFYTLTSDVGRGNKLPETMTILHKIVPTSGDSVNCTISIDYSNDKSIWYAAGNIDTVLVDSTGVAAGTTTIGLVTIYPVLDFRYFRLKAQSNTVDTFSIQLQKSVKF